MIGAGAVEHERVGEFGPGAADQLQRPGPIEAHAALGRVHGLGDAEPKLREMPAEGHGGGPVDRGGPGRIGVGEGIGHDMGGREDRAVERLPGGRQGDGLRLEPVGGKAATDIGEHDLHRRAP